MNGFSKATRARQLSAWASRLAAGVVVAGTLTACSSPPKLDTGGAGSTLQQTAPVNHAAKLPAASPQGFEQKYCAAFLEQETDSNGNTPTIEQIKAENGMSVVMESFPGPELITSGLSALHRSHQGLHNGDGPVQIAGGILASLPKVAAGFIPIPGVGVIADAITSVTNNVAASLGENPKLLPESNIALMQTAEECDPTARMATNKLSEGRTADRSQINTRRNSLPKIAVASARKPGVRGPSSG